MSHARSASQKQAADVAKRCFGRYQSPRSVHLSMLSTNRLQQVDARMYIAVLAVDSN